MMYMRQLQAAESNVFYMSPETVDELGIHLKKHIAEAKILYERGGGGNQTQSPPQPQPTELLAALTTAEINEDDVFNFDKPVEKLVTPEKVREKRIKMINLMISTFTLILNLRL